MSDTLEVRTTERVEGDGLAHSIAAAGLQVSQAADELREAAERLMQAEQQAVEAEARARAAEEQLEQGATKNAELLEMLQVAREGQTEADERRRRTEERLEQAEAKLSEVAATLSQTRAEMEEVRSKTETNRQEVEAEAAELIAEAQAKQQDAETRAQLAEEQLGLVAAQNAELLTLVERAQESRADGDEEARQLKQQLDQEVERAQGLERQLEELEARVGRTEAPSHVTVIVGDDERSSLKRSVAAEVRRPLTSILGLALALKHTDAASSDAQDMVRQLAANARKLDRLVGQMLDLDEIANGTFVPNRRRTDLEALTRRVIEESQDLVKRDVRVEAEHVAVGVDPQLAEQMIDALLANAGKRTAPGNPVWVKIHAEEGGVVIAVEDTGPEVPAGLRSAMFAALADDGGSHKPRGSTGLSLLARLAEIHGGTAWVEERPGGGASFRVFLAEEADGSDRRKGRTLALVPDPEESPADAAPTAEGQETDGDAQRVEVGELPDLEALRELLTS